MNNSLIYIKFYKGNNITKFSKSLLLMLTYNVF